MTKEKVQEILKEVEKFDGVNGINPTKILTDNKTNIWFTNLYRTVYGINIACSTCNGEVYEAYNKLKNLTEDDLVQVFTTKYKLKSIIDINNGDVILVEIDGEQIPIHGFHTPKTVMTDKLARAIIKKYPSMKDKFEIKADEDLLQGEVIVPKTDDILADPPVIVNTEIVDDSGENNTDVIFDGKTRKEIFDIISEKYSAKELKELIPDEYSDKIKKMNKTSLIDFVIDNLDYSGIL